MRRAKLQSSGPGKSGKVYDTADRENSAAIGTQIPQTRRLVLAAGHNPALIRADLRYFHKASLWVRSRSVVSSDAFASFWIISSSALEFPDKDSNSCIEALRLVSSVPSPG